MSHPLFVLSSTADALVVLRRLALAGWLVREDLGTRSPATTTAPPEQAAETPAAESVVHYGRIDDDLQATAAITRAHAGHGVVAIVDPDTPHGHVLLAGLGRAGPVQRTPDAQVPSGPPILPGTDPTARLPPLQRALLARIAAGYTIAEAAAAEYLSLRTANRRIAQARACLHAVTTREAVLIYLRYRGESST